MSTNELVQHIITQMTASITTEMDELLSTHATLYLIEAAAHRIMEQVGHEFAQGVVTAKGSGLEGPTHSCACGGKATYVDQNHPLTYQTSVGHLRSAQRARYHCADCGAASYPLDHDLDVGHSGRMSRYLQERCAWLASKMPMEEASQTLEKFHWPAASASQVQRHAEDLGHEVDQRLEQRCQEIAQEELAHPLPTPVARPPTHDREYAGIDGFMYCTRTHDPETHQCQWREMKTAVVYEAAPGLEEAQWEDHWARTRIRGYLADAQVAPMDQAEHLSYVMTTGPWEELGPRLHAELWERGARRQVRDIAVVADGAPVIDEVVQQAVAMPGVQVTRILDYPHAVQHLWAVARVAFPQDRDRLEWLIEAQSYLEGGQVEFIVAAIQRLRPTSDLAQEESDEESELVQKIRTTAQYFLTRFRQIDYPEFVRHGYQIGSGLAESACKRFGTDRLKGTGMRWTVAGAQRIATLRAMALSDRWDEVVHLCSERPAA